MKCTFKGLSFNMHWWSRGSFFSKMAPFFSAFVCPIFFCHVIWVQTGRSQVVLLLLLLKNRYQSGQVFSLPLPRETWKFFLRLRSENNDYRSWIKAAFHKLGFFLWRLWSCPKRNRTYLLQSQSTHHCDYQLSQQNPNPKKLYLVAAAEEIKAQEIAVNALHFHYHYGYDHTMIVPYNMNLHVPKQWIMLAV